MAGQRKERRKLIEVRLPLEAINRESARERSIRHGHPSTLHLWWARRPLAACRAVLFAQLVDDPSVNEELSEDEIVAERKRLFGIIEELVKWENIQDKGLLRRAHDEIVKCFNGKPPEILDPFAGGGSIPLEAQRLGLQANASDLNPVAVLINKALIAIPPRWAGRPPVFRGAAESRLGDWPGATGLAEDVHRYGQWLRDEAEKRVGHLYPKATLADGTEATVIAWLWARTVTCPNPTCGARIPMISSLWLSKKKNRQTWLRPVVRGRSVSFEIAIDPSGPPASSKIGRGARFACLACQDVTTDYYVKAEGVAGRIGRQLLAVVVQGSRRRIYLPADELQTMSAEISRPNNVPEGDLADDPRNIWCVSYGLRTFADLFTNRQLATLTTFSDLVREAFQLVCADARARFDAGEDVKEYATAVATFLAFAVSKIADRASTIASWDSSPKMESLRNTFARQAIPMTWDYAEGNPFSTSSGNFADAVHAITAVIQRLPTDDQGRAWQSNAVRARIPQVLATDPPYYDNISYADLSDFFYIWLRRSLSDVYPELFATLLTPKADELIASPHRHSGSRAKADKYFESGFVGVFSKILSAHTVDAPMTLFYAFRQTETDQDGTVSTGWDTMLSALIGTGFSITATWPIVSELGNRSRASGTNSLTRSIVLACRPRPADAGRIVRGQFIDMLRRELPEKLREMEYSSIPPPDLAQVAIGPGMAVFSRYNAVLEPDGTSMSVRTALAIINNVLGEVLEQEGDFDTDTRFCLTWFDQHAFTEGNFGTANILSLATNTSTAGLERGGIFHARGGRARLLRFDELSVEPARDERISVWEVTLRLAWALHCAGIDEAGRLLARAFTRVEPESVKALAYLLYPICDRHGEAQPAQLFNALGTSWSDVVAAARRAIEQGTQTTLSAEGA